MTKKSRLQFLITPPPCSISMQKNTGLPSFTATGEEMKLQESWLTAGIKILDTKLGTRAHMYQTPVFMLSLNENRMKTMVRLLPERLAGQVTSDFF